MATIRDKSSMWIVARAPKYGTPAIKMSIHRILAHLGVDRRFENVHTTSRAVGEMMSILID